MNRLHHVWAPLLAALAVLGYEAYQGQLDTEVVAAVVLFLIVAAVVNTVVPRFDRKRRAKPGAGA